MCESEREREREREREQILDGLIDDVAPFFLLGGLSGIGPPGGYHKEINRVTGQRTFFAASVGREREKERKREGGRRRVGGRGGKEQ